MARKKIKVALMIDTTPWIEQAIIKELKDICEVSIVDIASGMGMAGSKINQQGHRQESGMKGINQQGDWQESGMKGINQQGDWQESVVSAEVLICWKASAELINKAKGLKLIHVWGAGIDQIDIEAAQKKDIAVCTTQGAMAQAIGEYVIMQILLWERELIYWNNTAHLGDWDWSKRNNHPFTELSDRTLGVIGLGKIGAEVVRKATDLGMKVWGIKQHPLAIDKELHKKLHFIGNPEDMKAVLGMVDYVTLHLPLTRQTHHLFNRARLQYMKPTAVLINTSRGDIIDEAALAEALKSRWIRGASLDVLSQEPIRPENPLKGIENLILTCHQAGHTIQAIRNTINIIKTNIQRI